MVVGEFGNGFQAFELVNGDGFGTNRVQGQTMAQQLRTWQSGGDQRAWLSMLIDTMEQVSRPELRAMPCDGNVLTALRAQLARPATSGTAYASGYSLRN